MVIMLIFAIKISAKLNIYRKNGDCMELGDKADALALFFYVVIGN